MFSVRIISVDHYQSMPTPGLDVTYSQFRGTQVKQVPVIRIFGTTPTGQKTCLHVHGVFPYFYVPYDGSDESAARLMYQIAASLDKAINISLGHSNSNTHHVFKVVLVSGKPFYGYHSKEHQFLKVFLYNPLLLKRAVDLLQNGVICNRVFQPHEAHIPFILQFFIDYNLYGMNFIELKSVVYRIDVGSEENMNCDSVTLGKESLCEVEADAVATDILNRFSVSDELAVNPGLAAIWEDEKQRRGEGKEISQQESQPRPCRNPTISELLLKEKLKENLRMQGRNSGQRSVLQEIPYPAETQEGSNILNASTLDTHHMSSLELLTQSKHEESIVNEELVLSLTSTNDENALNSQDKSMVYMLVELAEMNAERRENQELLKTVIDQNIEDDSILGSQMVVENEEDETLQDATVGVEENQCQSSLNHVYDELLSEYEPLENQSNPSSHHGTEENCNKYADDNETMKTSESGVQWDDTFWDAITDEDIPQLDGANDILCNEEEDCTSIKTQLDNIEHSAENNSTEDKITDPVKSSSTAVWNSVKDNNWCSEIYDFSILQTDGMHSEGDNESDFGSVENTGNNLINILRGNPSLTSLEGSSADDLTCTINKSSCGNSVVVPRKEFENSCKKNIVSGVCIGRIDDSCDVKRNIWKDTSESDIYKADCKDDSHDYSTNTVPLSAVSISEIEGCENVCDGIVCSEPLCYDNLLETSQFDDNLSPSSFIEYQKVEPVVSSNKSTETVSPHREREYNTMISHRFQKGKLKIKFSFCNTKKLSRKLKKKTQKSCKSRLIHKAFNFIDYVTEDMISSYFTQIETLKQHQSNTRSKMDKGIINLSWSKISVEKPQWRKNRHKKNSILKIDMNMSLKADNLNINNFDSDIRELLPCGDPSVSSEHLHCDQASPVKNKCKEISPKCKIQNCDLKLKRQSEKNVTENIVSNKTCVVTVQQLTCDNINSILNHHQVKSPSLHALQQLRTSDSSTHELTMLKSITGSTSKSQLCKSSDTRSYQIEQTETHKTCKTESEKQLQTTLKVSLHEVLLSGPCSNMSGVNCLSSKFTQYHSVPEDIVEQCNKAVVIVDKLNAQNLANVHQSHSEGVTDSTAGTTGSPRKSQLNKSSDICQIEQAVSHKVCKTESDKQLKGALKVTLHKLQLSSSCSKYSSSTLYHSIPEKTIEQHDKSLAVVSQINDKSLANVVHQSQSAKSVTDRMSGINSCFVKLEKIDSCEERLKCNSKLQSENRNPDIELQGNIVSHKLCTKWNGITTVSKFCQKLKNIGKDNVSPYSEVKHERLVETSPNLEKPSTEDKDTSLRGRKCTRLNKKFSCKTLAVLCKKNILSTGFYLTKEINTLQHTNNETFVQVRNICESRRRTLRMSNFHNIQDNVKLEKNVRTLVLEKENKRLNEKASRISRSRQCMKHENTIPNIMCIDGTYDSSSSDSCDMSCDSQQNSSSKLIQTPKRHRRAQGCKKQATPKHRYKPLRIEIKKSPTSKCTSYEQKNSQQVGKLQAEFRVDVGKDNKDIRKAKNKRPAVENEPDTLTVYKTEGPKKVRVEQRSPVTSAASREKVVRNTRSAKKAECSPQKTIISCDMTDINRRGINDLHLKELRVCLQRLKFKNGKPVVVEENRRLTCGAISRLNNAQ